MTNPRKEKKMSSEMSVATAATRFVNLVLEVVRHRQFGRTTRLADHESRFSSTSLRLRALDQKTWFQGCYLATIVIRMVVAQGIHF